MSSSPTKILHAAFTSRGLFIWAEQTPTKGPLKRRKLKLPEVLKPYKLAAPRATLYNLLNQYEILGEKGVSSIYLPTLDGAPIPSDPSIGECPPPSTKAPLFPWAVRGFFISEVSTNHFLLHVIKQGPPPGWGFANDLLYWGAANRFVTSLMIRKNFMPTMVEANGKFYASWLGILTDAEIDRSMALAKAMPMSAKATDLLYNTVTSKQNVNFDILNSFAAITIDGIMREDSAKGRRLPGFCRALNYWTVEGRWQQELLGHNGLISIFCDNETKVAKSFQIQVKQWLKPLTMTRQTPYRLCFRLEEPSQRMAIDGSHTDRWHLRYLVRSSIDHGLIAPFNDIWDQGDAGKKLLQDAGLETKEYLLMALGRAAKLCPQIGHSLNQEQPAGCELDTRDTYDFLSKTAPLLESSGFTVMVPSWWAKCRIRRKIAVKAKVKPWTETNGFRLGDVMEVDWSVAMGDQEIPAEDLERLAELKIPLIQWRGEWVEVNGEELQATIDFIRKKGRKVSARNLLKASLGADSDAIGLPMSIEAPDTFGALLGKLSGSVPFKELVAPAKFAGDLRPYQVRGYSWLAFLKEWDLGACLADDMGLGKTVQTLALIQQLWTTEDNPQPSLLVCPTSVVSNWLREAKRFTPQLPVLVHHGQQRYKGENFEKAAKEHAIVVSSYSLLHRDIEHLRQVPWANVILDEAQNIKNAETKQAHAACLIPSGYRIALTGTPVENNLSDLWSIMNFLNPGLLGSQGMFKQRFLAPIQKEQDAEKLDLLKRVTSPFILRRLKTDKTIISDLPNKMEMKVYCNLTKEQAALYAAVLKDEESPALSSTGIARKGMVLALITKLKQICNHPAHFLNDNSKLTGRSGKLARLTEMLEEIIAVGDRALIFTQYTTMGELLKQHLEKNLNKEVLFLHGGTTKKKRDDMVERFQGQTKNELPIFVLSLKAGGTGLNLTRANHVFHFDRWWNPAVENQATDRAFRIGQNKNVEVHKFICAGTLEDKIDELIERKKGLSEQVVGTGEGWLTELSNEDLRNVIALRQEAIGDE